MTCPNPKKKNQFVRISSLLTKTMNWDISVMIVQIIVRYVVSLAKW